MRQIKAETVDDAKLIFAIGKVKDMLKSNKITKEQFDMSYFDKGCGTTRCIGGWADFVLDEYSQKTTYSDPLLNLNVSPKVLNAAYNLFNAFPARHLKNKWGELPLEKLPTKKNAIVAIDNFLAGKNNPWEGVKI